MCTIFLIFFECFFNKISLDRQFEFKNILNLFILQFSASNILKSVRAIRLLQQTFRTYIKRQAIRLRRLEKIWDAVEFDYVNVRTNISI